MDSNTKIQGPETCRQTHVERQVNELAHTAELLSDRVDTLACRLGPVILPVPVAPVALNGKDEETVVHLAARLRDINRSATRSLETISGILQGLEL